MGKTHHSSLMRTVGRLRLQEEDKLASKAAEERKVAEKVDNDKLCHRGNKGHVNQDCLGKGGGGHNRAISEVTIGGGPSTATASSVRSEAPTSISRVVATVEHAETSAQRAGGGWTTGVFNVTQKTKHGILLGSGAVGHVCPSSWERFVRTTWTATDPVLQSAGGDAIRCHCHCSMELRPVDQPGVQLLITFILSLRTERPLRPSCWRRRTAARSACGTRASW
jgi:hypothetical protein